MSLSPVGQEVLWFCLADPGLVGSVRDFAMLLSRTEPEILAALDELAPLGCIQVQRDAAQPSATAVVFAAPDPATLPGIRDLLDASPGRPAEPWRPRSALGYSRELIGRDPRMQDVFRMIDRASRTNATVLVLGESGVGKEVVARAIHAESLRSDRPFTIIDCTAIPPTLLESELFGHERGSFTTALRKQIGKFEEADGGTVLLDEIAELPLDLQVKLLRVLQTRRFTRVGGTEPIAIDVRFMATTNRRLDEMVRRRAFREDLYYRLNVVAITVPPLRERPQDISLLAHRIVAQAGQRDGARPRWFTPDALLRLQSHDWPGNVRELENVLLRALIVAEGPAITPSDLTIGPPPDGAPAGPPSGLQSLREIEIEHIRRVLAATDGNESRAARVLGIHRDTLYRKLRRYRIPTGPPESAAPGPAGV